VPVDRVRVANYRSIADTGDLALGPVTLLVGPNNSGKSALLRAIYLAQVGAPFNVLDTRLRAGTNPTVNFVTRPPTPAAVLAVQPGAQVEHAISATVTFRGPTPGGLMTGVDGGPESNQTSLLSNVRPGHFMVPVFSRRKTSPYETAVTSTRARQVSFTDGGLTSQLAMLLAGDNPAGVRYRELLERVFGVFVGVFPDENGQQPGIVIGSDETVSLERMGEGVSGGMVLLAELSSPGERLLLIEEPENDLHPKALRSLIEVVRESVPERQFIISTHSDLVLRHLGSVDGAVVYRTTMSLNDRLPTTSYTVVSDAFERSDLLEDMGYEPNNALGWLIFEESSAERIVRQILIPEFAPRLAALRTVSARGATAVEPHFVDLHRTVLFSHLSSIERRAWVIVDGDDAGKEGRRRLEEALQRLACRTLPSPVAR
jgi:predicted ATPase